MVPKMFVQTPLGTIEMVSMVPNGAYIVSSSTISTIKMVSMVPNGA